MSRLPCSETKIFEACMLWVKTASKEENLTRDIVQTHMGNAFYEIAFGSLSFDEFTKLLPAYGNLFSGSEYNEILQLISGLENKPKMFKGCHRVPFWNEKKVIKCNRLNGLWTGTRYCIGMEEITTFSTNTGLFLGHFLCAPIFKKHNVASKMCISATIFDSTNETEMEFCFDYSVELSTTVVKLPRPMIIKPRTKYEIRLQLPLIEAYMFRELESTVKLKGNIVVEFLNDHGHTSGIIAELGFNLLK